jgi:dTDP-4-amino-4,6-dideoxygalactose transaminase
MALTSNPATSVTEAIEQYLELATASDTGQQEMHLCGSGAVAALEAKLRGHYGVRHALLVSNATVGLFLIALAIELKRSSFLTTPYTYGGSLSGWLLLGNQPTFCDIEVDTLALDSKAARCTITPKTKALLSADIYGTPADDAALRKLADDHGLWFISDAAQSLGATRDGRPASALADAFVVSFTVGKPVSAGEGGAVLTNNSDLYEKLVWIGSHPYRQTRDLGLDLRNEFAFNSRPHPLGVIWANAIFDESLCRLKTRQEACFRLIEAINSTGLTAPTDFKKRGIVPSFFRLSAAWKDQPCEQQLIETLRDSGFDVNIATPPVQLLYKQAAFLAQFGRRFRKHYLCCEAERQERLRFCIVD